MSIALPIVLCALVCARCVYEVAVYEWESRLEDVPRWTHDWGRGYLSYADMFDAKGEQVELGLGVVRCNVYTGLILYFDNVSGQEEVTHRPAPLEIRWKMM